MKRFILAEIVLIFVFVGMFIKIWDLDHSGDALAGSEKTYYGTVADYAMDTVDDRAILKQSRAYIGITTDEGNGYIFWIAKDLKDVDVKIGDYVCLETAVEKSTELNIVTAITIMDKPQIEQPSVIDKLIDDKEPETKNNME